MNRILLTIGLLVASNLFMTFAWYYHLKHKAWPLVVAIIASWGIAFFEYVLQVPANRFGHIAAGGAFTLPQLKVLQEAITLTVFSLFVILVFPEERLRPTDLLAFGLIFAGVAVSMLGRGPEVH